MPELPEVEITARLLGDAAKGSTVKEAFALGVSTLKSYDPPLETLIGRTIQDITRRGKFLLVHFDRGLHLLIHLMSAGRLQLHSKEGSLRDKTTRLTVRLEDGNELRLREFGTKQRAWAKLLDDQGLANEELLLLTLGPEAWPEPPDFRELLKGPRPLHSVLRDQKVIAGIGRSWVDEILHAVKMSPFKRADSLNESEAAALRSATVEVLGGAISHYQELVSVPIPDKFPMPLKVHRRKGEPCPRCGTTLQAVHFEDHVICYCPECQTGGKPLKDRRLSRLLK